MLRDTLVAVTADHGEALNEHGAYGHGGTFYQELIHIPLILWDPRRLPQGKDVSALASQVDFLPTLLEALEVPVPEEMQGQSLMPSILGTGKSRTVYGENHHGAEISQFVIDGRWKLVSRTGDAPRKSFSLTFPRTHKNGKISTSKRRKWQRRWRPSLRRSPTEPPPKNPQEGSPEKIKQLVFRDIGPGEIWEECLDEMEYYLYCRRSKLNERSDPSSRRITIWASRRRSSLS